MTKKALAKCVVALAASIHDGANRTQVTDVLASFPKTLAKRLRVMVEMHNDGSDPWSDETRESLVEMLHGQARQLDPTVQVQRWLF